MNEKEVNVMTCTNWMLTILAVVVGVFAYLNNSATMWVNMIAAVLILIIAWTMVKCKPCEAKAMIANPVMKGKK
ncbi:MAG: hypothetical protein ABIG28_00045 [archaeon]